MTTEQSVSDADSVAVAGPADVALADGGDYWHGLVDEKVAADFLGVTPRTMQLMRQRGGGSRFVRLSSRCIRYRRIDLRMWSDAHLRTSTADPGPEGTE